MAELTDELDDALRRKLSGLDEELHRFERVVVAFSGGADSAFLTAYAARTLGARSRPRGDGGVAVARR